MRFDSKDIEAVAKSRISRAEGNKMTYWMVGCVATIVIGAFAVQRGFVGVGWILSIIGLIAFVVYMNTLSKKQNIYKRELLSEWEKEQNDLLTEGYKQA